MARGARLAFVLAALFVLFSVSGGRVLALEGTTGDAEQRFVSLANDERTQRGLGAVAVRADLVEVARRQAARMAAEGRLFHNPNLRNEVQDWEAVGENVGTGMDVDQVHVAFMNSSAHRDNILSGVFTEIGVGVVPADDGGLWVAQVFRKPAAPASEPPPPPPPPSTTTTTEPPAEAPPVVRAASAPRAAPPTTAAPAPAVEPEPTTTTEPPAPAPTPDTVPVVVPMTETRDQVTFDVAPPASTDTVRLSTQPVSFTSEPEVSVAIVAGAGVLLLVVAGQTATLRRLRLI